MDIFKWFKDGWDNFFNLVVLVAFVSTLVYAWFGGVKSIIPGSTPVLGLSTLIAIMAVYKKAS